VITDREIAGRINALLGPRYDTVLLGGAPEPVYLPPIGRQRGIIRYTRDYAQSVLHEIAHWCLAGPARRRLPDYGCWYVPPPRSPSEQAAFFAAEERVQALECVLAGACGLKFHVSADQLGADVEDFTRNVTDCADAMQRRGISGRAHEIFDALRALA
jgi:elongation factor P hydroxylase